MIIRAAKHLPLCDDFTFTAIDFERANNSYASICQVGICAVEQGKIIKETDYLVKPPEKICFFLPKNTKIHGITEEDVKYAPSFTEVWNEAAPYIEGRALAAHSFRDDEKALVSALRANHIDYDYEKYGHICTLELAIRAKIHDEDNKYNLEALSEHFGITITPHNAGSDAAACAKLVLAAAKELSITSFRELADFSQEPEIHIPLCCEKLTEKDIDKIEKFVLRLRHKKDLTVTDYPRTHLFKSAKKILHIFPNATLDMDTALSARALSAWAAEILPKANKSWRREDNGWWYRRMRNKGTAD